MVSSFGPSTGHTWDIMAEGWIHEETNLTNTGMSRIWTHNPEVGAAVL